MQRSEAAGGEEPKALLKPKADALQAWIARGLFAGAVLMLLLVTFAAKFDALQGEATLEQADIARNVACGRGLCTLAVRPLSLALAPDEPDRVLYTAPAYPVILAGMLRMFGVSDRVIALTALLFLMLTLVLTFIICRRLFDERTGIAAVAVTVITVPLLQHVVSGTEVAFLSLLVTGLFGVLFWWTRSENQDSDRWPIAVGVIVTIAWLTRYEMAMLLPVVVIFWLFGGRKRMARRLLWTVIPFIIVAGLWTVRNSMIVGRPMVSAWSYYLLADTTLYPATVVTRLYEEFPHHPWYTALENPRMMADKFIRHFGRLYYALPMIGNPFVTAFFIVGTVMATVRRDLALLHWINVVAIGLIILVLCLYLPTPAVSVCFVPVITILAVRKLIEMLEGMAAPDVDTDWDGTVDIATRVRMRLGLTGPHTGSSRLVATGVVMMVLVAGYPLAEYLFLTPAPPRSPLIGAAQQMSKHNYRIVMSNVPEMLSWYGGLSTVEVPASGLQLTRMQEAGIVPDAIFLTPTPAALQIEFPGYRRVEREGIAGLLWEPAPPGEAAPASATATEAVSPETAVEAAGKAADGPEVESAGQDASSPPLYRSAPDDGLPVLNRKPVGENDE